MTAYTTHADALFEADKPILGSTALETRDNNLATAEGSSGAPRHSANASSGAAAGDTILRSSVLTSITTGTAPEAQIVEGSLFRAHAAGTSRFKSFAGSSAGTGTVAIVKRSSGSTTPVDVATGAATADISYVAGDVIYMEVRGGDGSTSGTITDAYFEHHTDTYRVNGGS